MTSAHRLARPPARGALALAALAAIAAPAGAHTTVGSTVPRADAVLAQPPRVVVVRYGAPLQAVKEASVSAGGRDLARRPRVAQGNAREVVIPVATAGAPAGAYRANWTVIGADGHAIAGELAFRVRPPTASEALARVGRSLVVAARRIKAATEAATSRQAGAQEPISVRRSAVKSATGTVTPAA